MGLQCDKMYVFLKTVATPNLFQECLHGETDK